MAFGEVNLGLGNLFKKPKSADPADLLLQQLQASVGSPPSSQDLYSDALSQVSGAYQAQLGNLGAEESRAKARQKTGDAQLKAMYGALQRDIGKNAGDIRQNFDSGIASSKANTAGTLKGISGAYQQSAGELGNLFSRLGIEAAAPDAMGGAASDRAFLSGLANVSGQSDVNMFNRDKATGLAFNTQQQNIAGLTGTEKRSGLMTQLNDALMNIGQQRNSVYGQMSDAVSQRQYQLEQDAMSRNDQMSKMMYEMYSDQGGSASPSDVRANNAQQYSQMGPSERGYYKASSLFGPDEAGYVMQLINGVANNQNGGVYQNVSHFIRSVLAENDKQQQAGNPALDPETLESLASYYWSEGGTGRKENPQY